MRTIARQQPLDMENAPVLDETDRRIIIATQAGLPLCRRPYHAVADELAMEPAEVMQRIERMLQSGIIRRIGAVPNHYALGYRANGMTVWDVDDDVVEELGPQIGQLDFVSHCYLRPRHLPGWPYNLFVMVHGRKRLEVEQHVAEIGVIIGIHCRQHDILYSSRILKKTGLRIGA